MARTRSYSTGCSVYWKSRESLSPFGKPVFLEIYQDMAFNKPVKGSYLFAIGQEETLNYAWKKYWTTDQLVSQINHPYPLIERIQLPPLMFGWAAVINEFKNNDINLWKWKLIEKCPYDLEDARFYAEIQAIFYIQPEMHVWPSLIIKIVEEMYENKLNQYIIDRQVLNNAN